MVRTTLLGVVGVLFGLLAFSLTACANIDEHVDDIADWAQHDPVFADVEVRQKTEGVPTKQVKIAGILNVDTVSAFCDALLALHAKQEQMKEKGVENIDLNVRAPLGSTWFFWKSKVPQPEYLEKQREAYELVADPAIEQVTIVASDSGYRVDVNPAEFADENRTIHLRDSLYRTLDASDTEILLDFRRTPLVPGGEPASLELGNFPASYMQALAFVKRVDSAVPTMQLSQVDGVSQWRFYTEGNYNEAELLMLKKILSEPIAGESASVIIDGPDGRLGWAFVGAPLDDQPDDSATWSPRMQALFAQDA